MRIPLYYMVTLRIEQAISAQFLVWLKHHISGSQSPKVRGMLELQDADGQHLFVSASIYRAQQAVDEHEYLEVRYLLASEQSWYTYEQLYAEQMRADLPEVFRGKILASRKITCMVNIGAEQPEISQMQQHPNFKLVLLDTLHKMAP